MASTRTRQPRGAKQAQAKSGPALPIPWIVGGVVAVALVVAVVLSFGSESTTVEQYGSPAVSGQSLATFASPDAAVGSPIPNVDGADFGGEPVSIAADGTPKAIVFLAHWCSHCRNEVPAVQAWLDEGGLPAGVELIAVATGTDPGRPNYPPSEWLEREGFSVPVVVDDAAGTVARAYGLPGFPYWVFADGDGTVVQRAAGAQPIERIQSITAELAG